jgi:hypothetical protein
VVTCCLLSNNETGVIMNICKNCFYWKMGNGYRVGVCALTIHPTGYDYSCPSFLFGKNSNKDRGTDTKS